MTRKRKQHQLEQNSSRKEYNFKNRVFVIAAMADRITVPAQVFLGRANGMADSIN
jgi:hypothetical protein